MNSILTTPPFWWIQTWESFRRHFYFKFVLPNVRRATLDGIEIDLEPLPILVRNRLLNVGYEKAERVLCDKVLTTNDFVLELGGGIGFIGIYCQRQLGVRHYITVEPNPDTIAMLKRNYRLNGLAPVVWNLAAGTRSGEVRLRTEGNFWEHSLTNSEDTAHTVKVQSATLPELLARAGEVTTLIVDVEGAEMTLDFTALPSSVKKVIMELHFNRFNADTALNIVACLASQGFRIQASQEDSFAFVRN